MSSCVFALPRNADSCARAFSGLTSSAPAPRTGCLAQSASNSLMASCTVFAVLRHDAETAAPVDVEQRVVEAEHQQRRAIDDHELAVIADEVVPGPVHCGAGAEQPLLELSQPPRPALIGVGDERVHLHAPSDGVVQRPLDVVAIEAEDDDLDALPGLPDRRNQRCDAVAWLNQELHARRGPSCSSTRISAVRHIAHAAASRFGTLARDDFHDAFGRCREPGRPCPRHVTRRTCAEWPHRPGPPRCALWRASRPRARGPRRRRARRISRARTAKRPRNPSSRRNNSPRATWDVQIESLWHALFRLPTATLLSAVLAFRPRRRGTPKRQVPVIQTQIILAIVGAMVMLVVGASLARAFGIVGAAGLIRYRAKIDDPKDAGVMLSTLAIGLASGVGLYLFAAFGTVFVLGVLWIIESLEPEPYVVVRPDDHRRRLGEPEGRVRRRVPAPQDPIRAPQYVERGDLLPGEDAARHPHRQRLGRAERPERGATDQREMGTEEGQQVSVWVSSGNFTS